METTILETLQEFLKEKGITIEIKEIGYREKYFDEKDEERLIFDVRIQKDGKFFYYDFGQSVRDSFYIVNGNYFKTKEDAIRYSNKIRMTTFFDSKIEVPKTPSIADVLYCAYTEPCSFNDFCDDFGYYNDSISHKKMYEKCMDISYWMEKVIGRDSCKKINEILQDY